MRPELLGELAALGTAACWAFTAFAFESAGRRVGSVPVNLLRLVFGLAFLIPFTWLVRGTPALEGIHGAAWGWLGLSGLIGFAIGDLCLFRAFVLVGARRSVLMMSLVPPLAALVGRLFLGETLTGRDWLGMAVTLTGVTWVVRERTGASPHATPTRGVLLGLGAALGQAVGLVLSKHGMGESDPLVANQVRVLAGIAGFAAIFTVTGGWPRVRAALRDTVAMSRTALGGFLGPFLGVSLSLFAVQRTEAGVAATLMALTPVLALPLAVLLSRERLTLRGALGALVAFSGAALLFG